MPIRDLPEDLITKLNNNNSNDPVLVWERVAGTDAVWSKQAGVEMSFHHNQDGGFEMNTMTGNYDKGLVADAVKYIKQNWTTHFQKSGPGITC